MISPFDAAQIISSTLSLKPSVLAQDIQADRDYPPFHRVMMDGIAVKFEAWQKGRRKFSVVGVAPAGGPAKELTDEECCLEVMTGAPLPDGASLVIPYEHLRIEVGVAEVINPLERKFQENIHLKGSDCKKGQVVLTSGAVLNGPHAGIAASMGATPTLTPSAKIMIISTGDELVDVGTEPQEHQIRRSNAYALKKSLELNGISDVRLDHLQDDPHLVHEHYQKHAPKFDVLIYSGGVSKGKFDYLPSVWADAGVKKLFHEVAQRPGKPLWFGVDEKRSTCVVGLPGNPVSSLVCLHRYLIPGREIYARLAEEIKFAKELTYFVPVKLEYQKDGSLWAHPLKIKNSGEFTALAGSDGFIELPAEKSLFSYGEAYRFFSWRNS